MNAELIPPVNPLERSSVFSDDKLRLICNFLRDGATRTASAQAAGIHKDTLYHWMKLSSDVSDMVTRAEAEAELNALEAVRASFTGDRQDWRAGAWWLERRRRADYGQSLDLRAIPVSKLQELLDGDTQGDGEEAWPYLQPEQIEAADTPEPEEPSL